MGALLTDLYRLRTPRPASHLRTRPCRWSAGPRRPNAALTEQDERHQGHVGSPVQPKTPRRDRASEREKAGRCTEGVLRRQCTLDGDGPCIDLYDTYEHGGEGDVDIAVPCTLCLRIEQTHLHKSICKAPLCISQHYTVCHASSLSHVIDVVAIPMLTPSHSVPPKITDVSPKFQSTLFPRVSSKNHVSRSRVSYHITS